jgi:hypothetical protein
MESDYEAKQPSPQQVIAILTEQGSGMSAVTRKRE